MSDLDVGQLTRWLRTHAQEVGGLWPSRAAEFGPQEIRDVQETIIALGKIVRETATRQSEAA